MKEAKLKPFDLDKALAGEKVITRDGIEVRELHKFKTSDSPYPLRGVVPGILSAWTNEGICSNSNIEPDNDLYMAPTKIKYYIHVYKQDGVMLSGHPNTLNWKQWSEGCDYMDYIQTFEFEVED
jgi:hypothetical protein